MGRVWGRLSPRQQAGVALAIWAVAFSLLAVAAAIPGGPTASLSVDDATPIVGQTVHFDASASVGHDRGLGRIISYHFDFGDGTGTQDQISPTASHAYADIAVRRAGVTVRDARGHEGRAMLTVDVQPTPPPSGEPPDLAPVAALISPAQPAEGQIVSLSITIVNRGGSAAQSATIDVSDERPNGTAAAIGQTHLPAPLAPGASVDVYSQSFVAMGIGNHTLRIVVGNVTPAETHMGDNAKTIQMRVFPPSGPPPPNGEGIPLGTALLVAGLATAGVAALVAAIWLLLSPREPGPPEPPPPEPLDRSPPIRPP